ncbi:hypothetical protein PISMIDRAFT_689047 [Pisolithus microcarpus 441]|uniref:Uncharacterized protein n=1 Tax=Pisolithus microcarpus 441 TaxID=765257 RepID=A0A0C9YGK4_9AGAM|nr:hypothetical protein BKA83DRAFT_689047 [Pisolithus microcarpus]KIK13014.1 hypothetical protein PISMIDRAFT_689047 [Pisolithus microcarpus 441]
MTLVDGIHDFLMTLKVPSPWSIKGRPAYRITNVGKEEYLGVSRVVPDIFPPPPAPVVTLRRGVLPPEFTIVPVDVEANAYVILVDRRVTRDQDNCVFAFENEPAEVWLICYKEAQNAYIIEKREKFGPAPSIVWTALSPDGAVHPDQILLMPFEEPEPFQLFKFERVGLE